MQINQFRFEMIFLLPIPLAPILYLGFRIAGKHPPFLLSGTLLWTLYCLTALVVAMYVLIPFKPVAITAPVLLGQVLCNMPDSYKNSLYSLCESVFDKLFPRGEHHFPIASDEFMAFLVVVVSFFFLYTIGAAIVLFVLYGISGVLYILGSLAIGLVLAFSF